MSTIFSKKSVRTVARSLVFVIIILVFLEIVLRMQQLVGPLVDLNNFDEPLKKVSLMDDTLNHRPSPKNRDQYGIKNFRKSCEDDRNSVKVLFLGDSFMQGRGKNTIPQGAFNYVHGLMGEKKCLDFMNAGASSYSAVLYTLQARSLIRIKKPDFVVVEFDETDLMDDFLRYRKLMVRDSSGILIAVRHSPTQEEWIDGYRRIKDTRLYVCRLIRWLYHEEIYMPRINREFYGMPLSPKALLGPSMCQDKIKAHREYEQEISFFRNNLSELADTVISEMNGPEKILFSYHPHYLHLFPDKNGNSYNTVVSDIISEVCATKHIRFYNSTDDIKKHYGHDIKAFYRWPEDKFSHFTKRGFLLFGELLGRQLLPLLMPEFEEEPL